MTESNANQEREIERLKKKVQVLSESYSQAMQELNKLQEPKRRGRPAIPNAIKTRILTRYSQGATMRRIAVELGVSLGTVQKVIAAASKKARIVFVYMDRQRPSTFIDTNGITRKVRIVNLTDDMISRAFGIRKKPTWEDYENFLESRCMPRTRYGIKEELRLLQIDSYDPFQIVEKTAGRVYGDSQWLKRLSVTEVEQYDEILKSAESVQERDKRLLAFVEKINKGAGA